MDLVTLSIYILIYSLVGWGVGVAYTAIRDRRFVNRGFLNLPLALSEGLTAALLLMALPTLDGDPAIQFLLTWLIVYVMDVLTEQFMGRVSRRAAIVPAPRTAVSPAVTFVLRTAEAALYYTAYLLIHPFVSAFVVWLPELLKTVAVAVGVLLVTADYLSVRHAIRSKALSYEANRRRENTQTLGRRMTDRIWRRLERAYPGLDRDIPESDDHHVFAKGLCFDKLAWVFLVTSFLGALIEMVYCRLVGGTWMNRSSLVFGCFSVVWGLGAVVLTVVLQRFAGKPDRTVFLVGFLVGGAYEYLCSVFTELVYGTVFWDYSYMPLNIGGRTNALFCVFWGILGVVWVRMLYPPMERAIEKIPPLTGKLLTWVLAAVMLCNCLLTAMVMGRYTQRETQPQPADVLQAYLDRQYDDAWVEARWPNMIVPDGAN